MRSASLRSLVESRLSLYYGSPIALVFLALSLSLLPQSTRVANLGVALFALVPLGEGVALLINWGGRATAAAARYKAEPTNALVRNLPASVVRFVWGGGFAIAGGLLVAAGMAGLVR
jgi:Mg2+/citrate symporter